jgi:hypothetical protein
MAKYAIEKGTALDEVFHAFNSTDMNKFRCAIDATNKQIERLEKEGPKVAGWREELKKKAMAIVELQDKIKSISTDSKTNFVFSPTDDTLDHLKSSLEVAVDFHARLEEQFQSLDKKLKEVAAARKAWEDARKNAEDWGALSLSERPYQVGIARKGQDQWFKFKVDVSGVNVVLTDNYRNGARPEGFVFEIWQGDACVRKLGDGATQSPGMYGLKLDTDKQYELHIATVSKVIAGYNVTIGKNEIVGYLNNNGNNAPPPEGRNVRLNRWGITAKAVPRGVEITNVWESSAVREMKRYHYRGTISLTKGDIITHVNNQPVKSPKDLGMPSGATLEVLDAAQRYAKIKVQVQNWDNDPVELPSPEVPPGGRRIIPVDSVEEEPEPEPRAAPAPAPRSSSSDERRIDPARAQQIYNTIRGFIR